MHIAIVNRLRSIRELLHTIVETELRHHVLWEAENGQQAIDKASRALPDLILMDLDMPVMDGARATAALMADTPCPILVVASDIDRHAPLAFEALGAGALDAIKLPDASRSELTRFYDKVRAIEKLIDVQPPAGHQPEGRSLPRVSSDGTIVAIGASTGGPAALRSILTVLPAGFPASVVVIQHLDAAFAADFAAWLDHLAPMHVRIAQPGDKPETGTVLIAATNDHLVLENNGRLAYTKEPQSNPYRPSVDEFFNSLADHWHGDVIGIILTGIGNDGAEGLLQLKKKGHLTIGQDEKSCVVYGMPKAAFVSGAVETQIPPEQIGWLLKELVASNGFTEGVG